MKESGFLFRRLSRFIPAVLRPIGVGLLSIRSKFALASIRDVMFSANYWRIYEYLDERPRLVLDLGAHHGHFTILAHLVILERFGTDEAEYRLVEAVPKLIPVIERTLREAGLDKQARVYCGAVGRRSGTGSLHVNPENHLINHVTTAEETHLAPSIKFLDVGALVDPSQTIDILKIDIEGSEYDFIDNYEDLLLRTRLLVAEVHGTAQEMDAWEVKVSRLGFLSVSFPMLRTTERLLLFRRETERKTNE